MSSERSRSKHGKWLTWPNLLSAFRALGSPLLIAFATIGGTTAIAVLVILLVISEWLDGFLARTLHQESALGARLDTIADAIFYSCVIVTIGILDPNMILREAIWILTATGGYAMSWAASWLKFRRLPSYHTWAAKGAWLLIGLGIICYFAEWSYVPLRAALAFVALANLEAVAITATLSRAQVDVRSYLAARRLAQ